MKFSSQKQIQAVARLKSDSLLTTSFYLNTDKSRLTKKEIAVSFKNLLNEGRTRLESLDASRTRKESLARDLDHIVRFGAQALTLHNAPGLALFSCSGEDLWQNLALPRAPR